MFSFERRWALCILATFAPSESPGLAAPAGEVDYLRAFETLRLRSTRLAGLGLRAAVWLVALSPLWLGLSLRTLPSLPGPTRLDVLARLLEHPRFAIREATFLLKLTACLALLGKDSLRARSGYDGKTRTALDVVTS